MKNHKDIIYNNTTIILLIINKYINALSFSSYLYNNVYSILVTVKYS